MRKTITALVAAVVNLGLGAGSFIVASLVYLGVFVQAEGGMRLWVAILIIFALALVIVLVNRLMLKISTLKRTQYLFIAAPLFAAGLLLYAIYFFLRVE